MQLLVLLQEILHSYHYLKNFNLSIVAAIGAAAIYALSNERKQILLSVDYSVIVFFAAMFIVTSALWSSGTISMIMSYRKLRQFLGEYSKVLEFVSRFARILLESSCFKILIYL